MALKRVVVTGAAGFIGRHVLRPLLERGFEVHGVDVAEIAAPGVQSHVADLCSSGAAQALMERIAPSHLLHLAWETEPGQFWTSRRNLEWVSASLHLYRAFAAAGGRRAVMAGSCAEYDWQHAVLDEHSTPCRPATLYGIAKHALFTMLSEAARLDEMALAWGRIFFLYGPGEKPGRLVSDVVAGLLAGRPVETTAGTQVRDFMHVADVAGAFAAVCDSDVVGAINIASGEARPLAELLHLLGHATGQSQHLRLGARPLPAGEPPRLEAVVTRLRDEVGFRPAYDLATGLEHTVRWWRERSGAGGAAGVLS